MADQRITELVELPLGSVASGDVLPIVDITAGQTKKVQAKSLVQAAVAFIDASSIDIEKINQGSTTKIGSGAISDGAITYAKIQNVSATDKLLGRSSAGSGSVEEIDCTSFARTLLDDATAADARTTLGIGAVATGNTIETSSISNNAVTFAKIQEVSSDILLGRSTAGSGNVEAITLTSAGRALLDDADAAAQRTTLGLGSLATQSAVASGQYTAGSIATADIANGAITEALIASNAVSSGKLASGSVIESALADGAVTASKLASNSVTAAKLATDAVSNTVILASGIPAGKLAADAVVAVNIADDAITTAKIIDNAITTAKIATHAVTYDKIQDVSSTDVVLGRSSAGSGVVEEIPCTSAARSILDDATIADIRTTLGLGTLATQNGSFSGTSTGTNTGDQTITLSGDVSGTGTGAFATTIANSAVTSTKINDSAVTTAKIADGNVTAVKLAANSSVVVAASTPSASGAFAGQGWFNTGTSVFYQWNGSAWAQVAGLTTTTISGDSLYGFSTQYADVHTAYIIPSLETQAATTVFAGPASGSSDAAPTFRALTANDLPRATASSLGVAQAGTGLVTVSGIINHANSVASGTYTKVTVDGDGHVSAGTTLEATDIPSLDASKINSGQFGTSYLANGAVTGIKVGDYAVSKFGEAPPSADHIGQFFYNPLEKDLYLWDGNVWNPVGISVGEIIFAGTYNASGNTIASTTSDGAAAGLSVGQPLPSPSATFNRYYVVVESGGTGVSPAPGVTLQPPDLLLCNGTAWVEIDVSSTYVAQSASNVAFTPAASIGSTNVQAAIEEVSNECRNVNNVASGILDEVYGGTGNNSYAKGDLIAASGVNALTKLAIGTNGQVLTANSAQTTGMHWVTPASGTVLSVSVNTPLSVVSGTTTPIISIAEASTSVRGSVQLSDSVSTTSSVLAATSTAVKSAYDLANAALPRAGGTITGAVVIGTAGSLQFEGATDNDFEITLGSADATADRSIILPDVSGTLITTGDTGTVTNTMLAGSIADTKLSTISTAGKVSNSATTATNANTPSAIVARDGSGNFSAGTIDATIDEGSY